MSRKKPTSSSVSSVISSSATTSSTEDDDDDSDDEISTDKIESKKKGRHLSKIPNKGESEKSGPHLSQIPSRQLSQIPKPVVPRPIPPGLEVLANEHTVVVKQQTELLEILTGWEGANRYEVCSNSGEKYFLASEVSGCCCCRCCCGKNRSFTVHLTDLTGKEVFQVIRPCRCLKSPNCLTCIPCFQDRVRVETVGGELLGNVRQKCSLWKAHYVIFDARNNTRLDVWGPCMNRACCCGCSATYTVTNYGVGTNVGTISKKFGNVLKELFTDADCFVVSFPVDLDVRLKASMIGLTFLIDFMFFES